MAPEQYYDYDDEREPDPEDLCSHRRGETCFKHALRRFMHAFALSYGLRSLLSLMARFLHLLRTQPSGLLSLRKIVDEKHLVAREAAVRVGLYCGTFTGGFSALNCLLKHLRGKDDGLNTVIAGFFASFSLLFHGVETKRTLALYLFARLVQTLYNWLKSRDIVRPLWNGDALLFTLSSAQVMYAYVMRPESLPPSYWNFIVNTGPIHREILKAVKANVRGEAIPNLKAVNTFIKKVSPVSQPVLQLDPRPSIMPCTTVHPECVSCVWNAWRVFSESALRIFPLYTSLTLIPMIVRIRSVLREPGKSLMRALISVVRSIAFMASFCGLYQSSVCTYRAFTSRESKYQYFGAGIIAGLSIFLERRSRRSELALYVAPRAADSLFLILRDHKIVSSVPYGELLLYSTSVSLIMYFYLREPQHISPLLKTILNYLFDQDPPRRRRSSLERVKSGPSRLLSYDPSSSSSSDWTKKLPRSPRRSASPDTSNSSTNGATWRREDYDEIAMVKHAELFQAGLASDGERHKWAHRIREVAPLPDRPLHATSMRTTGEERGFQSSFGSGGFSSKELNMLMIMRESDDSRSRATRPISREEASIATRRWAQRKRSRSVSF